MKLKHKADEVCDNQRPLPLQRAKCQPQCKAGDRQRIHAGRKIACLPRFDDFPRLWREARGRAEGRGIADDHHQDGQSANPQTKRYHTVKFSRISGKLRTRSPVAAKIALHTAGATGGSAGSPNPVGGKSDWMKCASTSGALRHAQDRIVVEIRLLRCGHSPW